ncbi:MAG: hypothetical protein Q9160_006365 [Pyrenula sp. 1 TL-2023]
MSPQTQDVNSLVEALQTKTRAFRNSNDPDESRKAALVAAREVVTALEKPEEAVMQFANVHILTQRVCVKMGVDLRIFHLLVAAKGPVTSSSLAEQTGAEELFISKSKIFSRLVSSSERKPPVEGGILVSYEYSPIPKLPDYFKAKGYRCPTQSSHGPFQFIYQTDLGYFEKIHQSPVAMQNFNAFMSVIRGGRKFWADWYDVKARLLDGFKSQQGEVLLVDIGGGNGHDLETLIRKHPETAGHLVLEDLPTTVEGLEAKGLDPGIKVMGHDFFQEQPVKGVLPDQNCPPWFATNDINMMSINGGMQRDRRQWVDLVESVGLDIVEILRSPYEDDAEGVVEAVLKG